ncbi:hypothetical protein V5N11_003708 [Cardamine amara subsp. amara]|uniref:Uncharacterized protein n=1 Tax=Cardamine amara subsp. amara TaxID=228776 RepID=A0ABD1BZ88_CARAN
MKQCDRALSPFPIASSSSLPFVASESDPEDSFWSDFTFDFSFLTSEDHKNSLNNDHVDATIVSKELETKNNLESDLKCVDSQTLTSLALISDFDSNVTIGEGRSKLFVPTASVAKSVALANDKDDIELDSPCWRAPQFIPSNVKKKLDRSGREFKEASFKKSPSSSGESSITHTCEARIEQGSDQSTRISVLVHGADESLGLVSQDSVGKTMNILNISNELQKSKKLDPLAPVFVPEKHGAVDQMIAIEKNVHSTSALSSSEDMLFNNVKVETNSSEVDHSLRNVHKWGTTYTFKPQLESQVEIFENTKLDRSSNKSHGRKKLNPLAPQFSLESHRAGSSSLSNVKALSVFDDRHGCSTSSLSPKMDVKKLLTTIHGLSELLVHGSATLESPNEQDLDLINCTVQNLNSYINNRVQEHTGNYSSAIMPKRSIRDHQLPKAKNTSAIVDVKRKEKYSVVSGDMVSDTHFQFGVAKENGFGKVIRNHQTEEQINPQVCVWSLEGNVTQQEKFC